MGTAVDGRQYLVEEPSRQVRWENSFQLVVAECYYCTNSFQAQLQWPTGLSLSPLDGSLHFIDDRLVLKLTSDMKIKVVAGIPLHCHREDNNTKIDNDNILGTVLALAFAPNGDLYIAESDTHSVYYVRVIDSAGTVRG